MRRIVCAVLVLLPAAIRTAEPATHQIRLDGQTFTLPVGFTIERVAGPPLVDRPIVADFDELGRLYVADSSGSNEKVEVQLAKRPHRIVRLEPSANGRFERATVFADKMMFPEGVLWHAGSLYVAAPPSIWKLTDADGDGVAEQREEWFQGKTLTGCANDLHGPYLGPDGWLYWCKGAFAEQTIERPGKQPLVSRAAHIFRARPDGSGREIVMTGGMDNPVEVAFTSTGEALFTATFVQFPGGGRRDGLMHGVYGGVYGKNHGVLDGHIRTSPDLMPVMTHLGPAAPSGLCVYESTAFGSDFEGNAFVAQFNMRKISRHVLVPDGATFKTIDSDFLTSDNFDFHPTDVLEDADGSLLVIDTGGWYKLCCPTAQLAKPDVLGAIHCIRRTDAPRIDDPRGLKLDWSNPRMEWLDDPRPAVRKRAIAALAARGTDAIPELARACESKRSAESKRNAIWALTRIDDPRSRAAVRAVLHDPDETVGQAAAHSVSVTRDAGAARELWGLLQHRSMAVRRIAAEALGRCGSEPDVGALTVALGGPSDPVLEHSIIHALIEIGRPEATASKNGLIGVAPGVQRGVLIALDQMGAKNIRGDEVLAAWRGDDPKLRATAAWILGRHPEWSDQLAAALRQTMSSPLPRLSSKDSDELIDLLTKTAKSPAIQAVLAEVVNTSWRDVALAAIRGANVSPVPTIWIDSVLQLLENGASQPAALTLLRAWKLPREKSVVIADRLKSLARNSTIADDVRMMALAALPPAAIRNDADLETWLFEQLRSTKPVAVRSPAADIVARGGFSSDQLLHLAEMLGNIGPMEFDRVLDAYSACTDDRVGENLLTALATMKPLLRVATLRPRLSKFGPAIQSKAEKLYRELDAESAKQADRLDAFAAKLKGGDIRRGQTVFNSQKASCSACHAVGYIGGAIGPDLTKIGAIRTERDLLESILFPSASFVRGYEPISVMTKRGVPVNGLIKRDSPDDVVVTVSATEEVRIPRSDIESISPGTVSIMPAGLDQQLSEQDLADLIAFLKACR
jgi:putative membrane-bound dehydrogenase-like protein